MGACSLTLFGQALGKGACALCALGRPGAGSSASDSADVVPGADWLINQWQTAHASNVWAILEPGLGEPVGEHNRRERRTERQDVDRSEGRSRHLQYSLLL